MAEALDGGCQCGAVRYRATGKPIVVAVCHCTMCRKAHAAPAVTWAMFTDAQVEITAGRPAHFASSPEARRGFCAACGTQLTFTATYIPGLIDVTVGSLDRPEALTPTLHYWHSVKLPWVQFADDLPKHPEFPPIGDE